MGELEVDFKFHNVGQGLFYTGRLKYGRSMEGLLLILFMIVVLRKSLWLKMQLTENFNIMTTLIFW
ncbi:hypothetical protein [Thermococcus sp.]